MQVLLVSVLGVWRALQAGFIVIDVEQRHIHTYIHIYILDLLYMERERSGL